MWLISVIMNYIKIRRENMQGKTGLMLSGGGARAAYQVGVLKATSEIMGSPKKSPFDLYAGTSAGAINASFVVQKSLNWADGIKELHEMWNGLHAGDVYETGWVKIWQSAKPWVRMVGAPMWGGSKEPPKSLLDNTPLKKMLEKNIDADSIHQNVVNGHVDGLAITTFDYTTGVHNTFFDSKVDVEPWSRHQRTSHRSMLGVNHILASSALPLIFPSVEIMGRQYGDGAMRQTAPLSPLIKMGATKLVVVAGSNLTDNEDSKSSKISPATILGHAMASIFLDQIGADVERVERLNELANRILGHNKECDIGIKPVDMYVIRPSRKLDDMASKSVSFLPPAIKKVLGVLGVKDGHGGGLASYLLFEPEFVNKLIELGYEDTMRNAKDLELFMCKDKPQNAYNK